MIELLAVPALIALGAGALELATKFDWIPTMAQVRLFGTEFAAEVLKDNGDGSFLMKAKQHTARTAMGTQFIALRNEIIEMAAAEMPGAIADAMMNPAVSEKVAAALDDGSAALEAGMAKERETLPTPASLIASFRQDKHIVTKGQPSPVAASGNPVSTPAATKPSGVSVPPGPTAAPPAPNPQGPIPMSHLADKAKALAEGGKALVADAEAAIDAELAAQESVKGRLHAAVDKLASVRTDAEAGTAVVEEAVKNLTN